MTPTTGRYELLLASILTGVLGASTIYATEARLGLERFTPLAQAWTLWALFSASITFGVQHWAIRVVRSGGGPRVLFVSVLRWLIPLSLGVGGLSVAMSDSWFDGQAGFAAVAAALVVATGLNGIGRGRAAAGDDIRWLSILIVGENLIRFVLLAPLLVLDASPIWYGISLLAGFLVNVYVPARHESATITHAATISMRTMAAAATVGFVSYATMFGGPLLLGATGTSAAAISALFLVITLARIPFVVILGLLPREAARLEAMVEARNVHLLRTHAVRVVAASIGAAVLVGAGAATTAASTFGTVLGTNDEFGSSVYALVGAASIVSLGALVLSMAVIAVGRLRVLLAIWSAPLVIAAAGVTSDRLTSIDVLAWSLLTIEVSILLVLLLVVTSWRVTSAR